MRKTIITLVVAVASLVPAAVWADGMPPSAEKAPAKGGAEGTKAGASRVTMADLQPDAPGEYTVQKGDTLWGIAGRFLKDPWKWPQIWEMNRDQIKDPHWIYPGNVIRLDRSGDSPRLSLDGSRPGDYSGPATEATAVANVVKLDPRIRVETLDTAIPSIPGSAIGPFLTNPLVVEAGGLDGAPSIVATEESRVIVGAGDVAYADRIGTNAGLNWQVFRPGIAIRDPESGEILGFEAKYVADARVRRFGNPTTLEITKSRQEVNRGDRLAAARETSFPNYVPRAPEKPIRGVIMTVDDGVSEFGQFQIVTINRGSRDGLELGHVLASYHKGAVLSYGSRESAPLDMSMSTVSGWFKGWGEGFDKWKNNWEMRPTPVVPDPPRGQSDETAKAGAALVDGPITLPDERNGLVFVFRVFDKMSYAMVLRASRPIYIGDVVKTP
jgi:hypothetical protein